MHSSSSDEYSHVCCIYISLFVLKEYQRRTNKQINKQKIKRNRTKIYMLALHMIQTSLYQTCAQQTLSHVQMHTNTSRTLPATDIRSQQHKSGCVCICMSCHASMNGCENQHMNGYVIHCYTQNPLFVAFACVFACAFGYIVFHIFNLVD